MRIRGEAEAIQKKGRKVLILTYKKGDDIPGLNIARSSLSVGGFGKGVTATWKNIPEGIFLFGSVLRQTIYRRPKVLYGHLFEGAAIGIVAKYLAMLLSLFTYKPILVLDTQGSLAGEMGSYGMLKKGSFLSAFFRLLEKFILFFPDFIFASSIQCAENLKKISPRSNPVNLPDGISLFHKGVSAERIRKIRKLGDKEKILAKMTLSSSETSLIKKWIVDKKTVLLYTGSYFPAKGFPDFVRKCLPELLENENIRFLFGGGSGADIPLLYDLIENNPDKIISFPNLDSKTLPFFSLLGDIAVDCKPPKTSESSGKILNYMAVGLPVVCFNQKNNRFFLGKGGVYASDYSELRKNILQFLKNSDLRKEMGKNNLDRVWSKFTWDKTADRIMETISE